MEYIFFILKLKMIHVLVMISQLLLLLMVTYCEMAFFPVSPSCQTSEGPESRFS